MKSDSKNKTLIINKMIGQFMVRNTLEIAQNSSKTVINYADASKPFSSNIEI